MNPIDPGWNGKDPYEEEELRMQRAKELAARCSYKPAPPITRKVLVFFATIFMFELGWYSTVIIVSLIRSLVQYFGG